VLQVTQPFCKPPEPSATVADAMQPNDASRVIRLRLWDGDEEEATPDRLSLIDNQAQPQ